MLGQGSTERHGDELIFFTEMRIQSGYREHVNLFARLQDARCSTQDSHCCTPYAATVSTHNDGTMLHIRP